MLGWIGLGLATAAETFDGPPELGVLMVGGDAVKIGTPVVDGSKVTAEVVAHGRHQKVKIVKFNRRKHYRRETGHRQWFTEVKITGITA